MAAKDTIKDLRKKDENLVDGAKRAQDPGKLPENTPNVEKLREDEPETKAPASEAQSHKPTFGESAERPGTEQTEPEGDDSVKVDEAPEPPNPAIQPSDAAEDVTAPGARAIGEAHEENKAQVEALAEAGGAEKALGPDDVEQTDQSILDDQQTVENQGFDASSPNPEDHSVDGSTTELLETLRDEQDIQNNPDAFQRGIHQPTTEDVLAAPQSRPKTIDPNTGQVHYIGDASALPGGTVANEGKDA